MRAMNQQSWRRPSTELYLISLLNSCSGAGDRTSAHVLPFSTQMTGVHIHPSQPAFAPLPHKNQVFSCLAGQAGPLQSNGFQFRQQG